jgi:hypothetical protein
MSRKKVTALIDGSFLIHINHLVARQYQLSKTSCRAYITAYGSSFFSHSRFHAESREFFVSCERVCG